MSIDLFDASYYQDANPDLARAGITTEAQLRSHFETNGLNEGRNFSPLVNLNLYRALNPDLQTAGLTTNQQVLNHLQTLGVAEGRKFSQFVDLDYYSQSNQDVTQFFQGNRERVFQHLQTLGVQEGRKFSPLVNLNFYLESNSDVNAAFGGNRNKALQHLEINGLKEGRLFSPIADLNFYRDTNSDLSSFDNNQAFQHLAIRGVEEGREFSYPLDLDYYDLDNPDLLTYYASTKNLEIEAVLDNPTEFSSYNKFLLWHFENFGIREGRRSSDEFDVNYYRSANQDLAGLSNEQLYNHFRNFGINELRPLSDSYNAEYYSQVSSAPNASNLTPGQLFNYYITTGIEQGDNAVPFFKPPNEVLPEFDLISGNATISSILNAGDGANLDRKGSYSEEYHLNGLDPGQQVQLDLTADFDAYLQLVDLISGEVIAENDNIGSANLNSRINFTVDPGVEYLVSVSGDNANAIGAFTLSGQASSIIVGTLAANGGNVSDNLTSNDLPDPDEPNAFKRDYRLDLTGVNPGQELKIALNSASFDTYVELIDADTKEFIHFNDDIDDKTTDSQLRFVVESGVNYAVRVTSYDEQETGNFTLTSMVEAGTNPLIGRDETVAGTFTPDGDPNKTDIYTLEGVNPGEQIRINVESDTFDNSIQLLANGVLVNSNDDANGDTDSELTFTVEANTTYQIQVNRSQQDTAGEGHYTITTTPLTGEGSTVTLSDPGMQSLLENKTSVGREDVLAFINQATADGTVSVEEQADLKELASEAVALRMPDSVKSQLVQVNDAIDLTDRDTAVAATVLQSVAGVIAGRNPKPLYVGKGDTARGEAAVKQTSVEHLKIEGEFYGKGETRIEGINQGGLGDCAFLAALGAVFATPKSQEIIEKEFIKANGDGTYTFRFFDDKRQPRYVTVDQTVAAVKQKVGVPPSVINLVNYDKIPFANRGGSQTNIELSFQLNLNDGRTVTSKPVPIDRRTVLANSDASIWVSLAEKAYALFREDTANAEFRKRRETDLGVTIDQGYSLIGNGDNTKAPLERITGRQGILLDPTQGEVTFDQITNALNNGKAISVGTLNSLKGVKDLDGVNLEDLLPAGHAYTLTKAYLEGSVQRIVIRNPWGIDGGSIASGDPNDGYIDLTFDQLNKAFDEVAIV